MTTTTDDDSDYSLRENAGHAAPNERRRRKRNKFSCGGKWLEDDNVYMNSLLQQAHSGRQDYPSGQERAVTLRTAHRVTDHEDVPVRFSSSAPHTLEEAWTGSTLEKYCTATPWINEASMRLGHQFDAEGRWAKVRNSTRDGVKSPPNSLRTS